MKDRNYVKKLVVSGVLLAMGIIIPYLFHITGKAEIGKMVLPMHIPVLLGGFLLPPSLALLLGMITPLFSSLLTGMPPMFPMATIMVFELGIYGLAASVLFRRLKLPSILTLITSMIAGRIMAGAAVFVLLTFGLKMGSIADPMTFIIGGITTGLPGIIIQLLLIPTLIYSIERYTTINLD